MRLCSKTACGREAVASCSFSYSDRQVWLVQLGREPDPSSYDLCEDHALNLRAPVGWVLQDLRSGTVSSQAPLLP